MSDRKEGYEMNLLAEKGLITEMTCGSNFAYLLSNNDDFLSTEYKVLQSQVNSSFVKCMKMLFNGRIQLYYLISGWKPLSEFLENLEAESFLTIVSNLLGCIIDVKSNGFLACQNIDISLERIYVDSATYKVSLVYLPLKQRLYGDYSIFENELRTGLVRLISRTASLNSARVLQISSDLSNGMLTLEDLWGRLRGAVSAAPVAAERKEDAAIRMPIRRTAGGMRIIAMNAPSRVEIAVNKNSFIIGKSASAADGVVSFNHKISRRHCRIDSDGQQYKITDLGSTNGTKVNGLRLEANRPQFLNNGDVIRLADSDFQVVMG